MRRSAARERLRAVVTCGPTREPIDSVRFVSNRSSGILGILIAKALIARGVAVTLLHGPIEAELPRGARCARFETARDLLGLLQKEIASHNLLFMAAAVSDFRPFKMSARKLKRDEAAERSLRLVANPDILQKLAPVKKGVWVGFCVESENLRANALQKLQNKKLDLILAQGVGSGQNPFGDTKLTSILLGDGLQRVFRATDKRRVAAAVVQEALRRLARAN